jgi:hypothetical protein
MTQKKTDQSATRRRSERRAGKKSKSEDFSTVEPNKVATMMEDDTEVST